MQERIFLAAVHGHVVGAALAVIHEFNDHFLAEAFDKPIPPVLKGIGGSIAAAFVLRALVTAAGRVGLDFIGRTVHDVDSSAVGHPSWLPGGKVLVCVLNAAVMLVFELVVFAVGIGVAAVPEGFDELLALLFVGELHERLTFFVGDDPTYVLVQPLLVV